MKIHRHDIPTSDANLAVLEQGDPAAPAVVMTHSILSSCAMWDAQAALLASRGLRVLRLDTRGHGASTCADVPCTMDDLAADVIAVLDALRIDRAHYIGLSLGGMSGFGLGISHADRLSSLVLCDARADAPPAFAAPWDDRIAIARADGSCVALAAPTIERWFGAAFVQAQPAAAARLRAVAEATSVAGFVRCAQAIQQLDYLDRVHRIATPTTLIVGANDGPLPDAMKAIGRLIAGSHLDVIPGAGHLPNIDQPADFDAALLRHFAPFHVLAS